MKKLILLFFGFSFSISFAQTWDSIAGGVGAHEKYQYIATYALTEYNGNIVAGGWFDTAGTLPANNIAQWNGTSWDSLGEGVEGIGYGPPYVVVTAEAVYQGNLYVCGMLTVNEVSEFINGIAQWNGVKWDSVGSGFEIYGYASALEVYNGNLYAGGNFFYAGGILAKNIAKWNGTKWDSVSNGTPGKVYALTVYNGELYAGGSFDSIGHISAKNIAKWNDTNWSPVGAGIDSSVYSLAVYNGKLYAGGYFTHAGGVPSRNIAAWNDTNWNSLGGGISGAVGAITGYGSVLCVGGGFDSAGNQPANNIAYWDGRIWSAMGNGIKGEVNYTYVYSIYATASTLYVGGEFNSAGGIPAENIAQWRSPLGINELSEKKGNVNVFPNPSTGIFNIALVGAQNFVPTTIEVYNILGEKVYSATPNLLPPFGGSASFSYVINISSQPNGVYLYRVLNADGGLLGEGKMVIQK